MTHDATSEPFTPAAARAFMATLRAGLMVLAEWLLRFFSSEKHLPFEAKREVRETMRHARDDLFQVLVETYAHRLQPTEPKRRTHDHRARRKVRSPTPSHRSAISLKRVLKRTLPKPGRTLRERFVSVFFILRRFERLLRRFRVVLEKGYTSAWIVADIAILLASGRSTAPGVCDSS